MQLIENDKNLTQPKALKILFMAELWERFSFYGLRALLMLYMVSELGYNDEYAYGLYGIYLALVCASTIVGGYLADRYLGNLKSVILGSYIVVIGHLFLVLPVKELFFYGLSFVVVGTSLFKSNVSALLGEHYHQNDPRRDAGFTLFYMGVNAGPLIAPLICGYIGFKYGWNYGFGFAGLGMIIGIMFLLKGYKNLVTEKNSIQSALLNKPVFFKISQYQLIVIGCFLSVPLIAWAIKNHEIMGSFLNLFGIGILIFLIILTVKSNKEESKAMLSILVMLPFVTAFFACFEQAGASMNLFTDRYVDRVIGNTEIPTTWFQSINPLFVVLLAPLFSFIWSFLGRKRKDPLPPLKFVLALFQVSLSFVFLNLAVKEASIVGKSPMIWLVLAYLFQTTGEICLNPVGLSMITKLAPARFVSFIMGCFFLSIAFANLMAQQVAKYFISVQENKILDPNSVKNTNLDTFSDIFQFLIYFPLAAGILLFVLSPFFKKVFQKYQ